MDGITVYRENAILTGAPGKLVVLLYEGAIGFLRKAIAALEAKDYGTKGTCISKAQDILDELNMTLNMEVGGEVAANLRKLYLFMRKCLTDASITKDPRKIRQVIALLEDLLQGWRAIAE